MSRRLLIWVATLPLVGLSVLLGHRLAYALTGTAPGPTHDYLAHAPQVLAVLTLVALLGLALDLRSGGIAPRSFVALGAVVFAAQEHLEHALHGDALGTVVLERTFLVGVLLQLPVGLVVAWIARRAVAALQLPVRPCARPPLAASLPLVVGPVLGPPARAAVVSAPHERGPPRAARP